MTKCDVLRHFLSFTYFKIDENLRKCITSMSLHFQTAGFFHESLTSVTYLRILCCNQGIQRQQIFFRMYQKKARKAHLQYYASKSQNNNVQLLLSLAQIPKGSIHDFSLLLHINDSQWNWDQTLARKKMFIGSDIHSFLAFSLSVCIQ